MPDTCFSGGCLGGQGACSMPSGNVRVAGRCQSGRSLSSSASSSRTACLELLVLGQVLLVLESEALAQSGEQCGCWPAARERGKRAGAWVASWLCPAAGQPQFHGFVPLPSPQADPIPLATAPSASLLPLCTCGPSPASTPLSCYGLCL